MNKRNVDPDDEKETLKPGAHKRMAWRLHHVLEAEGGVAPLFQLCAQYQGKARQEWLDALDASGMIEAWVSAIKTHSRYPSPDAACLLTNKRAFALKIWGDGAFKKMNGSVPESVQAKFLIAMLTDVLLVEAVRWGMGGELNKNQVLNLFKATKREQQIMRLLPEEQPLTRPALFQQIAREIEVKDWEGLMNNVTLYKQRRGDSGMMVYLSEAEEAGDGAPVFSQTGADARGRQATYSAMQVCLSQIADADAAIGAALGHELKKSGKEKSKKPKDFQNLLRSGFSLLRDCVERKLEKVVL